MELNGLTLIPCPQRQSVYLPLETPRSCYLTKMAVSLGDEHAGLNNKDIACHLIGYGIYMLVEVMKVHWLMIWNTNKLANATSIYLEKYMGTNSNNNNIETQFSSEKLTHIGRRFAEKCKSLPTATTLRHFVVLGSIYSALDAIPFLFSPYV